ncbi:ORFL223W [Human betaherpesvirus 5]|nr:ORFL223W [Human betaherpesvirus 5]QHX40585.1 ORFL223W [Human betaherpesvirus 5]
MAFLGRVVVAVAAAEGHERQEGLVARVGQPEFGVHHLVALAAQRRHIGEGRGDAGGGVALALLQLRVALLDLGGRVSAQHDGGGGGASGG